VGVSDHAALRLGERPEFDSGVGGGGEDLFTMLGFDPAYYYYSPKERKPYPSSIITNEQAVNVVGVPC
jgi:hypothetical protein